LSRCASRNQIISITEFTAETTKSEANSSITIKPQLAEPNPLAITPAIVLRVAEVPAHRSETSRKHHRETLPTLDPEAIVE
jgi:hypothetical protein